MSEIISPPSEWAPFFDLTANDLASALGGRRIISIKSYYRDQRRLYCGILAKDGVEQVGWTPNMQIGTLDRTVRGSNSRLVALDAFWDFEARSLRCAAAWIKNRENWQWGFQADLYGHQIAALLESTRMRLSCIRIYSRPSDPDQFPPIAFEPRYAVIAVSGGGTWNWSADITAQELGLKLDDEIGRLVSIDVHPHTEGNKLAAVWWKNEPSATWFWNIGLDSRGVEESFPKFCSYGLDLVRAHEETYASIMAQFPKPADPAAANLMTLTGTGAVTLQNNLSHSVAWNYTAQNLTAASVQLKSATMFVAAEGGWCWYVGDQIASGSLQGIPLTLPPGASVTSTPAGGATNHPKRAIFVTRAEGAQGKHQMAVSQVQMTYAGFQTPAPQPVAWPVFIGLIGPVESVILTNGSYWVTVGGQVVNGTGNKLTITNLSLRMRSGENVVHEANLTDRITTDTAEGPLIDSNAPLARFWDAFDATADFPSGRLKVQVNVKVGGTLECFGHTLEVDVKPAPITVMSRLPHASPVWGDPAVTGLRWHWGNGVGATSFHAHSFPEHRYVYDIGVWDTGNRSLKQGGDPTKNEHYYCWNQEILAMSPGQIIFVDDAHPDNSGNGGNTGNNPANIVVLLDGRGVYQLYAHLRQGTAVDRNGNRLQVGARVRAGDLIGRIGNSGGSSEPHLHVGISRRDGEGFLRSLPMGFSRIKDGSGRTVSGVPVTDEFYSS